MKNKFNYNNLEELREDLKEINSQLPLYQKTDILNESIEIGQKIIPNRLAVHPMEGADADSEGRPSQLTLRRYRRFAAGGAGLIWLEAAAVDEGGRANQNQLYLNEKNKNEFAELVEIIKEEAAADPYLVAQLTHSGRFGENKIIAFHDEYLDSISITENDFHIITDAELDKLKKDYLNAAEVAAEAGFDAVDIKACHRYLLSGLLAANVRKGKYGGSYENRTRFLKETIKMIKKEVNIDIAVRLNIYDAIPNGWSSDEKGLMQLEEVKRLLRELEELGVKIINITASTPYLKPHINRPYDMGSYQPPEPPLVGVNRLLNLTRIAKEELSKTLVVGTGYSWLRQFGLYAAAGMAAEKWTDLAGFGRQAFAYPNFANDILDNGEMDAKKVCISCSKCAELKAAGKHAGCVVRDREVYLPIYQEMKKS